VNTSHLFYNNLQNGEIPSHHHQKLQFKASLSTWKFIWVGKERRTEVTSQAF